jgi:fibronectin-binding autotransporter adhesin
MKHYQDERSQNTRFHGHSFILLALVVIIFTSQLHAHIGNGTLTLVPPATGVNRLNVTVTATSNGIPVSDTETTNVTGTISGSLNANATSGSTTQMSISGGNIQLSNMSFALRVLFVTVANVNTAGLAGTAFTASPPAPVTPSANGGSFDSSLHRVLINAGTISGSALGEAFSINMSAEPIEGAGSGTGTITMVAGTASSTQRTFNATVSIPVDFTDTRDLNGTPVSIRVQGTIRAAGPVQIPLFGPCNWTGLSSNLWNNNGNWDTPPSAGDSLIFQGTKNATNVNNLANDTRISGITFSNTANARNFNVSGNRVILGGNITTSDTATTADTINDTIAHDLVLDATRTMQLGARHHLDLNGIISNSSSFGITKSGSGILTLNGINTFSGVTTIAEGTLQMASNLIASSPSIIVGNGATLNVTGTRRFILSAGQVVTGIGTTGNITTTSGTGLITSGNNAISTTSPSNVLTLTRLEVTGTGNTITHGNIQSGGAGLFQRGLVVGSTANGILTVTGGTYTSNGTGTNYDVLGSNNANTGTLVIDGGTYVVAGTPGRLNLGNAGSNGNGVLTLSSGSASMKTLAYESGISTGTVNLNGGTLNVGEIISVSGSSRVFNFNGGQLVATANLPAFSGLTLNVKNGGIKIDTNGFSMSISDALRNDGLGGLIKSGNGTLTLSGVSSYIGDTAVNGGTLLVNNSTGSGTGTGRVNVNSGTLGGNGTISGAVNIGDGAGSVDAILSPGNNIASIRMGNLALNSDGRYTVDLNGTSATSDQTHVSGTVTIAPASTLSLSVTGTIAAGQKYFILINDHADAISGSFSGLPQGARVSNFGGADLRISYKGNSVTNALSGGNDVVLYTNSVYDAWAQAMGLTGELGFENGETDDPDGDGKINRLEFAFDGNPLSSANDGKNVGKVAVVGGSNFLTLTMPIRKGTSFTGSSAKVSNPIDGLIYHIQASHTLAGAWPMVIVEVTGEEATEIQNGMPALSNRDGGGANWEYRTFRAGDPITANPRGFLRGMVEGIQP